MTGVPPLIINDLIGSRIMLQPGEEATIGRAGSFPVGTDDRYLHRILLQIWYAGQGWMIVNKGSHITVDIEPRGARTFSRLTLGPGAVMPVPVGPTVITFSTPERHYELHIDIPNRDLARPCPAAPDADTDETYARHTPTEEQRRLMDALAAPLLRHPGAGDHDIPTVREVAEELGWTEKATNHRIERLCKRLMQDGEPITTPYRVSLARYAAARKRR